MKEINNKFKYITGKRVSSVLKDPRWQSAFGGSGAIICYHEIRRPLREIIEGNYYHRLRTVKEDLRRI